MAAVHKQLKREGSSLPSPGNCSPGKRMWTRQHNFFGAVTRLKLSGRSSTVGVEPGDRRADRGAELSSTVTSAALVQPEQRARIVIFIGWQRGFESLLRLLDARLPSRSEVRTQVAL